jgi:inositol-pentakisphosphate 2-kinase
MTIATTEPSHWKYVSEGGATVVFSYIGPANPHFDGSVLRLRKASGAAGLAEEAEDPIVEFQMRCTSRLISPIHLPRLQSVSLKENWVQKMISVHDGFRPAERRSKGGIDAARSKGVLATDLVGGDWVAVEIKVRCSILTRYRRC